MQLEVISHTADNACGRPDLLFVHGGFHAAWCWDEYFLPFFQANGWNAHALSFRGHGKSDGAAEISRWTLANYVDDVVNVLGRIGERSILIGHSMGGVIAQRVWRMETERVVGMALLASSPLRADPSVIARLARERPLSMGVGQATKNPWLLRRAMTPFFFSPGIPGEKKKQYHQRLSLESPRAMAEVFTRPEPKPLEGDRRPVLIIAGREDWSIPLEAHEQFVQVYDAEFHICPGHHDLMLDPHWKVSASTILRWLKKTGFNAR